MNKKIIFTLVLFVFSGLLYAEDKPIEYIYDTLESKVEYHNSTVEGVKEYKKKVDGLTVDNLDIMGDLRTVITLDTPLNKDETMAFLEKYKMKPAQVVMYSIDPSGLLATSACTDPNGNSGNNIFECFNNTLNQGGEFIGTVAIYAFLPVEKIKQLKQDKRVYLVDYSGDPRRYSIRSKIVTDRLSADVQPFIGDLHHVAWPIYTKRLGLQQ
jgi:hypothetical protein